MTRHRARPAVLASAAVALAAASALAQPAPLPPTAATLPDEARARQLAAPPAGRDAPLVVTGGLGRGLSVRTADDSFSLMLRARIQTRATFELDPPASGSEDGFAVRRARLLLSGHALSRDLRYYFQLGFSNQDTESDLRLPLRDAYLHWGGWRDLNLRAGQMKVPFNRQRVISSSSLQFADRSLASGELNLDRDVGIQLRSSDLFGLGRRLSYQLGVFGGGGRNRVPNGGGLLWVARVQVTPFGGFEDESESDRENTRRPRLAVGFGAARNLNSPRARSTTSDTFRLGGFDYTHFEADLMFKWARFSLQAEVLYRAADEPSHTGMVGGTAVTEHARQAWGHYLQAGYGIGEHFEVAARWGEVRPLLENTSSLAVSRELGGALNWFFQRHELKLQADYFYLFGDDLGDGRHQIRVQAQIYF